MAKAKLKTQVNDGDVKAFLESVDNQQRRIDGFKALKLLKRITRKKPKMWGNSIVGFGSYEYRYESGREGVMPKAAFSPRKNALTFYMLTGSPKFEELLAKLGKHRLSKACLYINKWEDIDEKVLEQLCEESWQFMNEKYG